MMFFSTAGTPLSGKAVGTDAGIREVRQLGLDALEWEFVRGVRYNAALAQRVGETARENGISLSCHAPYFLNLLSDEPKKKAYSKHLILESARMLSDAAKAGAPGGASSEHGGRVVFHAGYFLKKPAAQALAEMREEFKELLRKKREERLRIVFAPELTGKPTAWGSLDELCELCSEFALEDFNPCIDFAHHLARGNALKTSADYEKIFDALERSLGAKALRSLHCHFSNVRYSEKGEINHLTIDHGAPPFAPLAQALAERKCGGVIVSESPNNEIDALEMKHVYERVSRVSKK